MYETKKVKSTKDEESGVFLEIVSVSDRLKHSKRKGFLSVTIKLKAWNAEY